MFRIYFDMCSLQRPLDDKSQLRVNLEAQAVLGVLVLVETGAVNLISSDVLVYECSGNPDEVRRDFANRTISKAKEFVSTNDRIKVHAQVYIDAGIKAIDALHLASAVECQADFFCTCDDRLLKRARTVDTVSTRVVSPLELISELQV